MSMTTSPEVAAYAATVRDELSDLGGAEARSLLDGLDEHLAEVAADGEVSLVEVLGPPAAYAAELRASAGLPVRDRAATVLLPAPAAPDLVPEPEPELVSDVGTTRALPPLPPPRSAPGAALAPGAADGVPAHHTPLSELAARLWLGGLAVVVFVVVARASRPISAPRILWGAVIVGALAATCVLTIRRSGLTDVPRRRLGVAMAGVAVLGAVWLGGQFSGRETRYVSLYDPSAATMLAMTTVAMSPFGEPTTLLAPLDVSTTSTAPAAVATVPDVMGLTADEAANVLLPLGVQVVFVTERNDSVQRNTVLAQSVEPGAVVSVGDVVTVTISGAPSTVDTTVPIAGPTYQTLPAVLPGDDPGPTGATSTTVAAVTTTATP